MSKRSEHTFQFSAERIAGASIAEAGYHADRAGWWASEQQRAADAVMETASIKLKTFPVTGGERLELDIDYGDSSEYRRMQEAFGKAERHRVAAERFLSDSKLYGSQDLSRIYELDPEDVHHFRLNGEPRED